MYYLSLRCVEPLHSSLVVEGAEHMVEERLSSELPISVSVSGCLVPNKLASVLFGASKPSFLHLYRNNNCNPKKTFLP